MISNNEYAVNHISFIMDGNGRWAKKRFLPRSAGHSAGVQKAKEVVMIIKELGIPFLSLYTFSKENWKRSKDEVSFLMGLIVKHFEDEFEFYKKNKIRIIHIGDRKELPQNVLNAVDTVIDETKDYTDLTLMLALNYSGKYDIIQAVNNIISEKKQFMDEENFSSYLLTANYPDPDLIIRTSGEIRLSNFFLYQAAYSELCVIDKMWPDLKKEDIVYCLEDYKNRERRFGGVKK